MIDKTNPPAPSGESFETGSWDNRGVAPTWKRFKAHEPYTKHIPSAVVAGAVALVVTLLTNSFSASRSEAFQYDQEQRSRIETVRIDINTLLDAVDERDDTAVEAAVKRVNVSSTFLPAYKQALIPLLMTISGKKSDLLSYRMDSIDLETRETKMDEAEVEKIQSEGWKKINWQATRLKSRLLLSPDPYTLECSTDLCRELLL